MARTLLLELESWGVATELSMNLLLFYDSDGPRGDPVAMCVHSW